MKLPAFRFRSSIVPALSALVFAANAHAGVIVYSLTANGGLAGFNAAAGSPAVSINFDSIAAGTNVGGTTISGITFNALGSPLIVVNGNATTTSGVYSGAPNPATNKLFPTSGANVLSPGGTTLGPGPDGAIENDDLELIFVTPLGAFGFDHLSQSADGNGFTTITVFNQANAPIFSGGIPISNLGGGGAPGGADFWGIATTGADLIGRIVINEDDGNNVFPDNNIGFDTFRFAPAAAVPDTSPFVVFVAVLAGLLVAQRRTQRRG